MASDQATKKVAFVTVGATAAFESLIAAVTTVSFVRELIRHEYNSLSIQYGHSDVALLTEKIWKLRLDSIASLIEIDTFAFKDSLKENFLEARSGVVLAHAGSGTVLETMRLVIPTIVVPNPELLDNHQVELAQALEEQGYVVHGKLNDLNGALERIEFRRQNRPHPVNAFPAGPIDKKDRKRRANLVDIIDQESGLILEDTNSNADGTIMVD